MTEILSRDDYVAALKARALELARVNDLQHAVALVANGLTKRPDTHVHHATIARGQMLAINDDQKGVVAWIEGLQ